MSTNNHPIFPWDKSWGGYSAAASASTSFGVTAPHGTGGGKAPDGSVGAEPARQTSIGPKCGPLLKYDY